jgi:hypothetical protein
MLRLNPGQRFIDFLSVMLIQADFVVQLVRRGNERNLP